MYMVKCTLAYEILSLLLNLCQQRKEEEIHEEVTQCYA